jgi:hypothetical protein
MKVNQSLGNIFFLYFILEMHPRCRLPFFAVVVNVTCLLLGPLEAASEAAARIVPAADDEGNARHLEVVPASSLFSADRNGNAAAIAGPPPPPYSVVGHIGPLPSATTKGGGQRFRCVLELYDAVRTWPVVPLAVKVGSLGSQNTKNGLKFKKNREKKRKI